MRVRRGGRITAVAAFVLVAAVGCGNDDGDDDRDTNSSGDGDGATIVSVDDNVFEPDEIEVAIGDTVTWEWVGSQPHNVSADDFESEIQTEGTFEHTFDEEGTFDYRCTVHPGMDGTVDVTS